MRNGVASLLDGEALENIPPAQEKPGAGVGKNHFSWTETLAFGNLRLVKIDEAGFGAGDEQTVVRQGVAQRAQSIAVEFCANKLAVGKDERGGAIPGLAVLRKRGQRAADVARKQGIFFKGRRNHGEHGFIGGEAFEKTQLETVVKARGVADVFLEHGEPRAHGKAGANFGLLGAKPAAIRDDGIDFTVMRDVAERLREMPGRLRVGRIPLVKNGKGGGEGRIAQVFVKLGKLPGSEQAFVDDGLRGKRANIGSRRQERLRALS